MKSKVFYRGKMRQSSKLSKLLVCIMLLFGIVLFVASFAPAILRDGNSPEASILCLLGVLVLAGGAALLLRSGSIKRGAIALSSSSVGGNAAPTPRVVEQGSAAIRKPKRNYRPSLSQLARLGAAVLLLWALDRHPYGYYTLLRWIVCAVSGYAVLESVEMERRRWAITFVILALLFNPLIPVRLDRGTWGGVDVAAALILTASVFLIPKEEICRSINEGQQRKKLGCLRRAWRAITEGDQYEAQALDWAAWSDRRALESAQKCSKWESFLIFLVFIAVALALTFLQEWIHPDPE